VTRLPSSPKTVPGGPSVDRNDRNKIPCRGPNEPHRGAGQLRLLQCSACTGGVPAASLRLSALHHYLFTVPPRSR
jgi:hypothetical protein